jgi:hypothetical protein
MGSIGAEGLFILSGIIMDNAILSFPFWRPIDLVIFSLRDFLGFLPPIVSFPLPSTHNIFPSHKQPFDTMSLNAAATPFVSALSHEVNTPYDVEKHLYDTPANIAHDNRVAMDFLTAHHAPPQFWDQAGYEDPNRTVMRAPGVSPLLDVMEREREDRIRKLEKQLDVLYVVVNSLNEDFTHFALEHWGPFQASLFRYFGHQCHGAYCTDPPQSSPVVPPTPPGSGHSLPQSSPWSPAPTLQMVERTPKRSRKSPMTRTGQRCRPSSKARQVQMRLKLEVANLQERYGFNLVREGLDSVRRDMFDGLEHDVLGMPGLLGGPGFEGLFLLSSVGI